MSHLSPLTHGLHRLRQSRLLRAPGWLSVPLFPLFCLFLMDYMNYGGHLVNLQDHWRDHPGPVRFEILVVLFLFCVLTLVLRRLWLSGLVFGSLSLVCAYVNYMKAALNGDHFYPQDLAMVTQAGELTSFLSGGVPRWFWLGAAALLLWIAGLWLLGLALPRPFLWRWSAAALLVLWAQAGLCTNTKADQFLLRFGMSTFDTALQSSNYTANGFVGAFAVNVLGMQFHAPEGYSRENLEHLLAPYTPVPAGTEERFDVVVVLSESFFDPRILDGVAFSENPLPNYDRLLASQRCQSGQLYTTAVGGGTVRPEFALLTGLTTDYMPDVTTPYWYVSKDFPTYVSHYRDLGYATLALHPYDRKFYARDSAYPHLGFEAFYGEEDMDRFAQVTTKRGYVTDDAAAQAAIRLVEAQDKPAFLFLITMENHQPFHPLPEEDIHIRVEAPALSQESYDALTTYTQGLADADGMLGKLAGWIDSRERPTVLLFFGDHLPTLGANYLAYNDTGLVDSSDGLDAQERQRVYSTPFVIYSNRELAEGLLKERTGNAISDYNLLNHILQATGMPRTSYMELLAGFYTTAPFYNVRLWLPLTPEIAFYTDAMKLVTYDRLLGKGWSAER